jgi:lipopolysaccharide transport system permease protein
MALRDVKVKYKQAIFGVGWAIIQPLATMLIFTLVFNRLLGVSTGTDTPYEVFSYAGLVPWVFFSTSIAQVSSSVIENARLVEKIYFPRIVLPIAGVIVGLPDMLASLTVLGLLMAVFGVVPPLAILLIPALILLTASIALGIGLWISALNVQYRDFRYIVPFVTTTWLYATPVAYPDTLVPERWRLLYELNPMVGIIQGFRWVLLGEGDAPIRGLMIAAAIAFATLVSGAFYFRRVERVFADVI